MAKVARFTQDNQNPVGMIVPSMLTEAQFQAINGTAWVLAAGQSAVGSVYATTTGSSTLPDLRGMTLRGKNNGRGDGNQDPDGDRALGNYQSDAIRNITATINGFNPNTAGSGAVSMTGSVGTNSNTWGANGALTANLNASNQVPTAADNRMKNIAVNYFIKIN